MIDQMCRDPKKAARLLAYKVKLAKAKMRYLKAAMEYRKRYLTKKPMCSKI